VVHVDGSCFGNGFKGAIAGVGVYWGADNPQ
jgi:ribonuclease HI